MVKEKSDKKKEAPALTEVQGDIEMGDVASEKVCYIQAFVLIIRFHFHSPQSPKKAKKEKEETVILVEDLSPLAHPLAQKKLVKKLHKIIKKGMDHISIST